MDDYDTEHPKAQFDLQLNDVKLKNEDVKDKNEDVKDKNEKVEKNPEVKDKEQSPEDFFREHIIATGDEELGKLTYKIMLLKDDLGKSVDNVTSVEDETMDPRLSWDAEPLRFTSKGIVQSSPTHKFRFDFHSPNKAGTSKALFHDLQQHWDTSSLFCPVCKTPDSCV